MKEEGRGKKRRYIGFFAKQIEKVINAKVQLNASLSPIASPTQFITL
jgi:hypothetical protein